MSKMAAGMLADKSKPAATEALSTTDKTPPMEKPLEKIQPSQPKNKPVNVESNGSLSEALKKGKEGLKPTETVERHLPVVGVESGRGKGRGRQYNIEDEEAKKEYFDDEKALNEKVKKVSEWIKSSKHVIMFTGAGISTRYKYSNERLCHNDVTKYSAGIPDFRSGMNTVLPTGPGVWEVRAEGSGRVNAKITPILKALPTTTHMSIVKLHESGNECIVLMWIYDIVIESY